MERKQHKALNFDLDTKALKQHYPTAHFRQAYRDIHRFLEANGFEHRQWSGYRSVRAMSDAEITLTITRLNEQFPRLSQCVNHFDVTNIGRNYDLAALFSKTMQELEIVPDIPEQPMERNPAEEMKAAPKRSRSRRSNDHER